MVHIRFEERFFVIFYEKFSFGELTQFDKTKKSSILDLIELYICTYCATLESLCFCYDLIFILKNIYEEELLAQLLDIKSN